MAQLINIGFGNMVNGEKIISMVSTGRGSDQEDDPECPGRGDGGGCHLRAEDADGACDGERTCRVVGADAGDHSDTV